MIEKIQLELALKQIFPNGDVNLFLHFYNWWHDLDLALYSYGEIREGEYIQEKENIKRLLC